MIERTPSPFNGVDLGEQLCEPDDSAVWPKGPDEFRVALRFGQDHYGGTLSHDEYHHFLEWLSLWKTFPALEWMDPMYTFNFIVPGPEDEEVAPGPDEG